MPLYRRVLEASERVFGKEHRDMLASVNNLAVCMWWLGSQPERTRVALADPGALFRRTMLGPARPGPGGKEFLRNAYHDIPVMVPAIREYWMPQHVASCSS